MKKNQNELTTEQQQLVNNVLNMENLKVESLVEATLKVKNSSKQEIEKKQKEILDKKIKYIKIKNERILLEESVDKELEILNEKERKAKEERKKKE